MIELCFDFIYFIFYIKNSKIDYHCEKRKINKYDLRAILDR